MMKIVLFAGLLAMIATGAAAQEFVSTRPGTIVEAELPPAPPPASPVRSQLDPGVQAYIDSWQPSPLADAGYDVNRIFETQPAPEPVPAWALEEPVRYVAEMCRPGVRPGGEEMEACFTRVEHEVNEARRTARAAPGEPAPPRRNCRQETTRSQDGTTVSSSYTCTVGDGDPALLEQLLFGD